MGFGNLSNDQGLTKATVSQVKPQQDDVLDRSYATARQAMEPNSIFVSCQPASSAGHIVSYICLDWVQRYLSEWSREGLGSASTHISAQGSQYWINLELSRDFSTSYGKSLLAGTPSCIAELLASCAHRVFQEV